MRYAIYYTPGQTDLLTQIAASWLGRDAFTGDSMEPPPVASLSAVELAYHTAAPRRYGFHATLKAPFRLADGETEEALFRAVADFADAADPVVLNRLVPARLDGFMALVPDAPSAALQAFAGDVVEQFDRFRAPLSESDLARRNPEALDPHEASNLARWGYPYVFENFRFHMTLTGRVPDEDVARVRSAIDEAFAAALQEPLSIDALALFVETEPGAPFVVKSWHALGDGQQRKIA